MAEIRAYSSVSLLRCLSVHLNPQSLLHVGLITLVTAITVVCVAPMHGTIANFQGA